MTSCRRPRGSYRARHQASRARTRSVERTNHPRREPVGRRASHRTALESPASTALPTGLAACDCRPPSRALRPRGADARATWTMARLAGRRCPGTRALALLADARAGTPPSPSRGFWCCRARRSVEPEPAVRGCVLPRPDRVVRPPRRQHMSSSSTARQVPRTSRRWRGRPAAEEVVVGLQEDQDAGCLRRGSRHVEDHLERLVRARPGRAPYHAALREYAVTAAPLRTIELPATWPSPRHAARSTGADAARAHETRFGGVVATECVLCGHFGGANPAVTAGSRIS